MSPTLSLVKRRARQGWAPWLAGAVLLQLACGSVKPPPPEPPPPPPKHKAVNPLAAPEPDDGMKVSGDILGSLDQQAIQDGINKRFAAAAACIQRRLRRQPYLGGTVTLSFRVALDGHVKRLRIVETNLGAYKVERCIHEQMRGVVFSKPRGGEAEFTYPLTLQSRSPVQIWEPGMVRQEITDNRDALLGIKKPEPVVKRRKRRRRRRRAKKRRRRRRLAKKKAAAAAAAAAAVELVAPDGLVITFYVDRRGRTVSAGMVADGPVDADFAERFIANLKKIKFEGARTHRYAKVTYRW